MTGKAELQWLNELTDRSEPVCECFFNKKGVLYHTGEVFRADLLPVICQGSANLTRALTDWIRIRERWKLRPDYKFRGTGSDLALARKNNYASPFDNYSFRSPDTPSGFPGVRVPPEGVLNYPLRKECFIDGVCVYSREVNKDSLLYRLCTEADLQHVFEPGSYEIVRIDNADTLCWKTRIDSRCEYIPFVEYVKPFLGPSVSEAESVVRCCRHYRIPGWQDLFFELCSIDGIVEIEKDLDSLFVVRKKEDIRHIEGLMMF